MNDILDPANIFKYYKKGKYDKKVASDLLITLIEESLREEYRINSLFYLGEIGLKSDNVRKFVENLMISDINEDIRHIAVHIIFERFLKKSLSSLSWSIQHENSYKVLKTILTEIEIHPHHSIPLRYLLLKRFCITFKVIPEEAKFFADLYQLGLPVNIVTDIIIENKSIYHFPFPFSEPLFSSICHIKNKRVIALSLPNKNLNTIPASIGNLKKLRYLNLAHNNLILLPETIKSLTRLRSLSLFNNNFKQLPESISCLKKLRHLNIKWTKITSTPNFLTAITRRNFSMKFIAEGVSSLEAPVLGLIELISKVKLEKIGQNENIHDYDFPHYFNYYKIDEEGHVIGLYVFSQSDPSLGVFPNQICDLKYLKELYLSNNEIFSIPDSIGSLFLLRELDLSYNNIRNIPESLENLHNLKILDISYNNIKELPEFFNNIPSLEILVCVGNDIKGAPRTKIERYQRYRSYVKSISKKKKKKIITF